MKIIHCKLAGRLIITFDGLISSRTKYRTINKQVEFVNHFARKPKGKITSTERKF